MERENTPEFTEKRFEIEEDTLIKHKRSSILKVPRMPTEDVNLIRSFRRVSFSSNFIKPFMTDDDKNTIWDTTIEETINNTGSTHSLEGAYSSKGNELNTSLFLDNVMDDSEEESLNMELTGCSLLSANKLASINQSKKNVFTSLSEENILLQKENIPPTINKQSIPSDEKENFHIVMRENISSTNKNTIMPDIYVAGKENIMPLMKKNVQLEGLGNSLTDGASFVKPTVPLVSVHPRKLQNIKIPEDSDVDEMELTCQTAESSPEAETMDKELTLDRVPSVDISTMDLTCRNPVLQQSSPCPMEISDQTSVLSSSTIGNMEFTCQNPIPSSYASGCMEITCQNMSLPIDDNIDMEFTCRNPVIQNKDSTMPNLDGSPETVPSNTDDMEFTCRIPVLQLRNGINVENSCENNVVVPNNADDMDFTCRNPVSQLRNGTNIENSCGSNVVVPNNADDMDFTCRNPVSQLRNGTNIENSCGSNVVVPNNADDMDFTCRNPVSQLRNGTNIENSCGSNVVVPNNADDMDFTCRNPVSQLRNGIKIENSCGSNAVVPNQTDEMEFTCRNPVLRLGKVPNMENSCGLVVVPNNATDMEFTCQNPVLQCNNYPNTENTCESLVVLSNNAPDMEFTCVNPDLQLNKEPNTENSSGSPIVVTNDMVLICQNPISQQDNMNTKCTRKSPVVLGNNASDMDFSCLNPVSQLSEKENLISASFDSKSCIFPDKDHNTNNSCGSPLVVPSYAPAMELTRQSTVLPCDYIETTEVTSKNSLLTSNVVEDLELICQNRVLLTDCVSDSENICRSQAQTSSHDEDMKLKCRKTFLPSDSVLIPKEASESLILSENVENVVFSYENPVMLPDNEVRLTTLDESQVLSERNCMPGSLTFRNNADEWNIRDYSTCVDGTMQLINCASNIINARNSTCDESSLGNVSKQKINITYSVRDAEETEKLTAADTEPDRDEEMVDEKGAMVVFIQYGTEGDLSTDMLLDQESSIVLVNDSNDHVSIEDDISKINSKLTQETGVPPVVKAEKITEDIEWDAAAFMARREERLNACREEWKDIKPRTAPVNDRLEFCRKRAEETYAKHLELERLVKEKGAAFVQYRDKIFAEILRYEAETLPIPEDDLVSSEEESVSLEQTVPTLIEEIEEKAKICYDCWKIIKLEDGIGQFTTLFDKLEFCVEYNSYSVINHLYTKSLLTEKARPIAYFLQKELLRTLTKETICNSIGQHYNVLTLLDYIQMVMEKIKKYYKEIKEVELSYGFTLTYDFKATFVIIDVDLLIKWQFTMDLSDLENMTNDCVSVCAVIGKVNEKHLKDFVAECNKGMDFISNYLCKVQEYVGILMKRKRLVESKNVI